MKKILELKNISKEYKDYKALDNVSFSLNKGEIVGLIGPNGAGKTTLMRIIVGLTKQYNGEVNLIDNTSIGCVIETPSFYPYMTGYENLKYLAELNDVSTEKVMETIELLGLKEALNKKVKGYSLGMRQRLGIAAALLREPKLLILDEPTNGLDPAGIHELREYIKDIVIKKEITVLISSHILDELSKLATYYGFIDNGKMIKQISSIELESKCRKCTHLKVSSTKTLAYVLDTMNIEYKILSNTEADIFEKVNISKLTTELSKKDCEVISIHEHDESLESYFVSLVGGARHE